MKSCARFSYGATGLTRNAKMFLPGYPASQHGFTLLEMCIVLFVIVLLLGLTMPAMQSTFVEEAVRNDATQLSLLVKTAMLKSADEHRSYIIDFTKETMTLHPATDAILSADDDYVAIPCTLNSSNKLLLPDPDKANGWLPIKSETWFFKPGELCSLPRVRIERGNAWLEMSFNALTGNVENETDYFP